MPIVETNGINMYYEIRGSGEPVVCIMGITAPGAVWEPHVDAWSRQFQCVIGDNRGVGASDKPEGAYTTAQMADDWIGLMDALDIDQARVVGVSMGSTIAQQMALRHPKRVKSMILMAPWARCDRYATAIFEHMKHIKAHLRPEQFMLYIQTLIFTKPHWDNDPAYQDLLDGQRAAAADPAPQPLHGLEGQAEACIHHNVHDQLGRIDHPCLVMGGKNDIFTPRWMNDEVHAALPNSEQRLFEDAGHAFHFEHLDAFNEISLEWLKAH
jgi:pimeloyl-ACP methyl ester carboxylesterase